MVTTIGDTTTGTILAITTVLIDPIILGLITILTIMGIMDMDIIIPITMVVMDMAIITMVTTITPDTTIDMEGEMAIMHTSTEEEV
jgi:hypothetical protein